MTVQTFAKRDLQKNLATRLATKGERLTFERKFFLDVFPFMAEWYDEITNVMLESGVLERAYIQAQTLGEISIQEPEYKTFIDETVNEVLYDTVDELLNSPMRRRWLDKIRAWKIKAFDLGAVHALRILGFQAEGQYTSTKALSTPLKFKLTNQQVLMDMDVQAMPAVSSIMGTTIKEARNKVKNTMFVQGKSVSETANQMKSMSVTTRALAIRIVRTETQTAYGLAVQEVYAKSGVKKKEWYTVGDHRVRVSHTINEGDGAIPIESVFSSGQKHPGDPGAGMPKHVNCRCTLIPVDSQPVFSPWTGI